MIWYTYIYITTKYKEVYKIETKTFGNKQFRPSKIFYKTKQEQEGEDEVEGDTHTDRQTKNGVSDTKF